MPTNERSAIRIATDTVLFTVADSALHLLLVERGRPPFQGAWALPGGLVEPDEPLAAAARRELNEETSVSDVPYMTQLATFGEPGRDPRGRVISVVFLGLVSAPVHVVGGDDAARAQWWAFSSLPQLAFDHDVIVNCALRRLRRLVMQDLRLVFYLTPEPFTLTEVQMAYEAIVGRPADRRNFRRRLLAENWVQEVGIRTFKRAGRPAREYRRLPDAFVPSPEDRCV